MPQGTMLVGDLPHQILTIYSRDAIFSAMPQMYFKNFVTVKQDWQREPGETVQFLKVANIPQGGELPSELSPIPKQKYSDSVVPITVKEHGNAIQFSKRALEASFRNLMQDAATLLGRDYGIVSDAVCRDAYLSTANKIYLKTNGVHGTGTSDVEAPFDTVVVKDAVEILKTLNAPLVQRAQQQVLICIGHPHVMRSLRNDSKWIEAYKYVSPQNMWNGESGMFEGVVFLETTQMPILVGAGAGDKDVYRTVVFGADCVGFGETVPFGLVNDGVQDFGRLVSIGWYSIFGAGLINDYAVEIQTL